MFLDTKLLYQINQNLLAHHDILKLTWSVYSPNKYNILELRMLESCMTYIKEHDNLMIALSQEKVSSYLKI